MNININVRKVKLRLSHSEVTAAVGRSCSRTSGAALLSVMCVCVCPVNQDVRSQLAHFSWATDRVSCLKS